MQEVVGIDSGGTKTIAVRVSKPGAVTSVLRSAGIDPTAQSDWQQELTALLASLGHPAAATLGLPYFGEIGTVSHAQKAIALVGLGPEARVFNDVAIAHKGALAGDAGLFVLAGTGSMAWAVGPKGTARAGGFGDVFGDEGSAFWVARQALARASHEIDGRAEDTGFANRLCAVLEIEPSGLIEWTYAHDAKRAGLAAKSKDVARLAAGGDEVARDILHQAAAELHSAGQAASRAAGLDDSAPWAMGGGLLSDPIVSGELTRLMGRPSVPSQLPPVGGAVLDAAQRAGWPVDAAWIARLSKALEQALDRSVADQNSSEQTPERVQK